MSDLTGVEKLKLEKFLKMGQGYALEFSNRSIQEFILGSVELDIQDEKYSYSYGSKANRLRALWEKESNYVVGKLLEDMLIFWKEKKATDNQQISEEEQEGYNDCLRIAQSLKEGSPVEHLDAIQANNNDKDFAFLAKLIRESIEKNEPEAALDRLHTFVMKYIRQLCKKHSVEFSEEESLNAVFGKYVRFLINTNKVESPMAEKILRFSINIIEAFNDIRNNRSFAHDNRLLNYHESILIFNNISSSIKFIDVIEQHMINKNEKSHTEWDEFKL